jgi:hypothetical protein
MLADEIARNSEAENADTYPSNAGASSAPAGFALTDEQVSALSADNFALKMLLAALLSRVGRLDPILASAIQEGFQDATDQVEHMIASCRWAETRDRCTSALASIRRLRAAVLNGLSSSPVSPSRL